jgi:hypothetical protein
MVVALAAAIALAPSLRSGAQALFTTALFLSSKPIRVVFGRRSEPGAGWHLGAWKRLSLLRALAILTAVPAWAGLPLSRVASLIPGAGLCLAWFVLFRAGRERTCAGKLVAALGFAAAALAVAAAGGASAMAAAALALALGSLFCLGTVLLHLRSLASIRA